MFVHIVDLKEQFIIDHNVMLNLRKSANVGSEKIRRSFPRQICFVFLFSLHDCSHPSSPRYHLPILGCTVCDAVMHLIAQCNAKSTAIENL